ncbi:hypothetical protein C8R45DRAFT_1220021 [Mycena sanguinolenta]|nr:hypothetical protein C8R45DRAFT_1220021 [Mycena sanguinolenta]
MNSPSAAVFGTSELCCYIIDFLHDSPKDLKSSALASRIFTFPAQAHLFYEIDISGRWDREVSHLSEILDEAPHLCPLIRCMSVPFDSLVLACISNMNLPRLNRMELFRSSVPVPLSAVVVAQNLLSLSSLHTLVISATFPDRAAFNDLFGSCTTLRTLDLRYVKILSSAFVTSPSHAFQRIQIKELYLHSTSHEVATWFSESGCPVDLSLLQYANLYLSTTVKLAQVLQNAGPTVEELYAHTIDIAHGLSLAHFPALRVLELMGSPANLINAFSSLPPQLDHLKVFIIASRAFQPDDDDGPQAGAIVRQLLAHIDSLVAAMRLPSLIRFELGVMKQEMRVPDSVPEDFKNINAMLAQAFPQMRSRGLLVIRDRRE